MVKKNDWRAWLYLAPVVILLAVFTFYPLINTFGIAFLKNYKYLTGKSEGFTFENFGYVLGLIGKKAGGQTYYFRDVIEYAIPNTMIVVFVTVPLSIVIALLISVGLNSIKPLKKLFQTIFFMPYVTNAIAVGMVFAVIFDGYGIWNHLFNLVIPTYWLDVGAKQWQAMFALCVYIVWHALPYKILILLSGLQNIDKQYYQAAQIDAAGKFKTFMNVTVPLLSPQILYIMITSFIGAFKEYSSVVGLLGKSGTVTGLNNMYTIVYYIYDMIGKDQVQLGAAAAVMLFAVIMIFTAIQFKVSSTRVHY